MSLDVKNLTLAVIKEDGQEQGLVDNLSFSIQPGQTLSLCGPSGCGKTSVALSLLDLLPLGVRKTSGEISIDGKPFDRSWRGRRLGFIFQEPRRAFQPILTIGQLMSERLQLAGVTKDRWHQDSVSWLEKVGIVRAAERLNQRAHCFSGGELQRIMLAMVLAQGPEFVIADEPTSNLDVLVQGKILALLKRLQDELSLGILMITHDTRVANSMSDHLVEMSAFNKRANS